MARVNYFNSCMCCSLRIGNIVYASYLALAGFVGIILGVLLLVYYDDERFKLSEKVPYVEVIGLMVFFIINEVFNLLLLIGVVKKISKLVLPWLIYTGMMMGLAIFITIYIGGGTLLIVRNIVSLIVGYLLFHCVLSYYKEIQLQTPTYELQMFLNS